MTALGVQIWKVGKTYEIHMGPIDEDGSLSAKNKIMESSKNHKPILGQVRWYVMNWGVKRIPDWIEDDYEPV